MLGTYFTDAAVLALLAAVPGPDVAVVARFAVTSDRSAATRAALGVVIGLAFWGMLSIAGLAGLLAASTGLYTAVKVVGAVYLAFLGARILLEGRSARDPMQGATHRRLGAPLRAGVLTNVLNPKIAVFYTGVLPSLVPHGASPDLWLPLLVGTHVALSLALLSGYAAALARSRSVLGSARVRRQLDRVTGVVLIGLGVRVALEAR